MQIYVHTDSNVTGTDELTERVTTTVGAKLARFDGYLTRVDVHLADESAGRTTDADQRCRIEARPAGRQPVAVTSRGSTVDEAVGSAIDKLSTVLAREIARRDHHKGSASIRTGSDGEDPQSPVSQKSAGNDATTDDDTEDRERADPEVHLGAPRPQ